MRTAATIGALGAAQTLAWASSYYLPAVLAAPMARDVGVSTPTVFAAFSAALLLSAALGPHAGAAIDRWGGRPVLIATNLVFATGLLALGLAQGPWGLFAAWAILGIGMGSGLYEAAFAALVRLYGADSRSAITGITLIAGFASTVGWPLSALLEAHIGWRGACFSWAALHLVVGIPLNALLPHASPLTAGRASAAASTNVASAESNRPAVLLAIVFAATWFVSTAMATHLPQLLQASGATLGVAVAVGALVGPAQVAGRLLEFGVLRHLHPLISARLAASLHPLGAAVLFSVGGPAAAVFALLHGAGNGILTIAKGTLTLVLFGPQGYGQRQGWLMVPARIAQALAPWLFGIVLDGWGRRAVWLSAGVGLLAFAALLLLRVESEPASRTETAPT
ncbi:MAG: MFS transporter [Pseudomonadota bacterium]|nr:MFS transporter [Pseudomonadota bacterium]